MGRDSPESSESRFTLLGLLILTGVGIALRPAFLDIPIRYDEAHTFLEYAEAGAAFTASHYGEPNNHVLHTLLVILSTKLFGHGLFGIRLPAFLAGCLVPLVTGLLALRVAGRSAALLACALAAGSPVLVAYSTNARGYTMVALFALLAALFALKLRERPSWPRWTILGGVSVAGLYTIPVMIVPWLGIVIFLALTAWTGEKDRRRRRFGALAAFVCVVGLCTAGLYLPILLNEGPGALTANRFVEGLSMSRFLGTLPEGLGSILRHWIWALPLPLVAFVGAGLLVQLVTRDAPKARGPLFFSLLLASVIVAMAQRNLGFERVWLWLLPFVFVAAALGWMTAVRHMRSSGSRTALTWAVPAGVILWSGATLLIGEAPRTSLETGAYPEGPRVAAYLADNRALSDPIITDFVSIAPLRYYLEYALDRRAGRADGRQVLWIVQNRSEPKREEQLRNRLAKLGLSLDGARPVTRIEETQIYRFVAVGHTDGGTSGSPGP